MSSEAPHRAETSISNAITANAITGSLRPVHLGRIRSGGIRKCSITSLTIGFMALAPAIIAVVLVLALVAAIWDLRTRRIPNWLVLTGLIAGFGLNGVLSGLAGLEAALIGMLTGFGIYLALYLLHAMGAGDVKFMAAVGSLVGWRWWFHIFFVAVT